MVYHSMKFSLDVSGFLLVTSGSYARKWVISVPTNSASDDRVMDDKSLKFSSTVIAMTEKTSAGKVYVECTIIWTNG